MLENQDMSEADKKAVLHENARRFYSLGTPAL
jgi:predicted TIM-barrel fold metal-dependent hydrolase